MTHVSFANDPDVFARADRLYRSVHAELAPLLPDAEVRHVGSTAVPGCLTKGDLDVVVRVQSAAFQAADQLLAQHFERNTQSDRTSTFSAFRRNTSDLDLGIQLVSVGSEADTFHTWVEQLRTDPALRRAYDALKRRFHGASMRDYRHAKSQFIARHLAAT